MPGIRLTTTRLSLRNNSRSISSLQIQRACQVEKRQTIVPFLCCKLVVLIRVVYDNQHNSNSFSRVVKVVNHLLVATMRDVEPVHNTLHVHTTHRRRCSVRSGDNYESLFRRNNVYHLVVIELYWHPCRVQRPHLCDYLWQQSRLNHNERGHLAVHLAAHHEPKVSERKQLQPQTSGTLHRSSKKGDRTSSRS